MPSRHERLLHAYAKELRAAKTAAETWWAELLEAEISRTGQRKQAVRNRQLRWPLGCAAHPSVVAVLRKYFLACNSLNDELGGSDAEEEVYPHTFTSEWLLEEETEDLADFIGVLTYWPIGLDDDGDFI